jgi:molybdopterin/thiamine biosynthesis adenylyltransferase
MSGIYDRQESLNLNTNQKIIVVGVGGVGWHVAKGLAMAGVNDIVMFDDDVVEIHNLPRLDVPANTLGKNKATLLKSFIDQMRPDNDVVAYPFRFNPVVHDGIEEYDWFVDCTDNHESQLNNQAFARENGMKYVKVGYNGSHITVANVVAEWDTNPDGSADGYTIVPSFICPAIIVAGIAVNKILTNSDKECSIDINDIG